MAYYYLQVSGEGTTFDIDTEAIQITFPGVSRAFSKSDLFSDGSAIFGSGAFQTGKIIFTKKFKKSGTGTAWNSLRTAVMRYLGLPKWKILYFYLVESTGIVTMRVRVWPISRGDEQYSSLVISNEMSFAFQMEKAYFEEVTETSTTKVLTTSAPGVYETLTVTNNGIINTPPVIKFTPSVACSLFQVELATDYGFRLESSFLAGVEITYDCRTGMATVGGLTVNGILTAGSVFTLEPGTNTLYIYAAAGAFEVEHYERFI